MKLCCYARCLLAIFTATSLCFVSCSDDKEEGRMIIEKYHAPELDKEAIIMPKEGGRDTITVLSEADCIIYTVRGMTENGELIANTANNVMYGNLSMTVRKAASDWFSAEICKKDGKKLIVFDVKPNTGTDERFLYIEVQELVLSQTIYLLQAGTGGGIPHSDYAPLVFSPKEMTLPAEGGTADFVITNHPSCGRIYNVHTDHLDDYILNESYWWLDSKSGVYGKDMWGGYEKRDFGWFSAGVSDDKKHVLVDVKPNTSNSERDIIINMSFNGLGYVKVRQKGKR